MYSHGLSRYLSRLGQTALLGAEQEVSKAREIARLKRAYWRALLSHPPVVEPVLAYTREALGEESPLDDQIIEPLLRAARACPADALPSSRARRRFEAALEEIVEMLAMADVDGNVADSIQADVEALRSGYDRGARLRLRREDLDVRRLHGYANRLARAGDAWRRARNEFVKANLRLVVRLARRHHRGQLPFEDLVQEGNVGLMTAVERFDPERGYRFSTYAAWWIRHAISRAIAKRARTVRLPVYMRTVHSKASRARQELRDGLGREPTTDELSAHTGIRIDKLDRVERALATRSVSLEQSSDEGYPLDETLPDDAQDLFERGPDFERVCQALRMALEVLDPVEYDILRRRFGLQGADRETLQEVGESYGLSRERIRQMQVRALDKLRQRMETSGISTWDG